MKRRFHTTPICLPITQVGKIRLGGVCLNCTRFLGYDKNENGKLIIIESKAVVVRKIFKLYLRGFGVRKIKKYLEESGIKTVTGKDVRSPSTIDRILSNEKYVGDMLMQKNFTEDFLTGKRKRNEGERAMFFIKNYHEDYSYNMPLLSFLRFIVPVFKELATLSGFPQNKDITIFIDDADNLSEIQTKILNTWIAYRTQPSISLKIATQVGLYKSYLTSTGVLIESPHDYKEINISTRYPTNVIDKYFDKAKEILEKRLKLSGINVSP